MLLVHGPQQLACKQCAVACSVCSRVAAVMLLLSMHPGHNSNNWHRPPQTLADAMHSTGPATTSSDAYGSWPNCVACTNALCWRAAAGSAAEPCCMACTCLPARQHRLLTAHCVSGIIGWALTQQWLKLSSGTVFSTNAVAVHSCTLVTWFYPRCPHTTLPRMYLKAAASYGGEQQSLGQN